MTVTGWILVAALVWAVTIGTAAHRTALRWEQQRILDEARARKDRR